MTGRLGRPPSATRHLTHERIVDAAEAAFERGSLSMRTVAKGLRVDPMALYRHVDSKEALVRAIAHRRFSGLKALPAARGPWRVRLTKVCVRYLAVCEASPELVLALIASPRAAEETRQDFEALVRSATARLEPSAPLVRLVSAVLADFLHGYALAPGAGHRALGAELHLIFDGLEARARSSIRTGPGRPPRAPVRVRNLIS
jgi:AcrR family transcriptional regulator